MQTRRSCKKSKSQQLQLQIEKVIDIKICGFLSIVLCILLASSALAVNPFDVHNGGFGPMIKGLQLGISMTLIEMTLAGCEALPGPIFSMWINNIGQKENHSLGLKFTKDGNQLKGWEITAGEAKEEYSKHGNLEELLEAVDEARFAGAVCEVGSDNVFIINEKNRVAGICLDKSAFDARPMSHKEFAQALVNAYRLPTLEWELNPHNNQLANYVGNNLEEGWRVEITEVLHGNARFIVYPLTIPGEFN